MLLEGNTYVQGGLGRKHKSCNGETETHCIRGRKTAKILLLGEAHNSKGLKHMFLGGDIFK